MTVRDRAKSRIREAVAIGAAVGGAALGIGVAVAATSPVLIAAPQSATAPVSANEELAPLPAQVKGYTILRPSSLVMDTPAGLRILFGTGLDVTDPLELEALIERARADHSPAPPGRLKAAPASPLAAPAPAPATAPATATEPDFPGLGEESRSERAEPKRSEKAEERAEELSAKDSGEHDAGRRREERGGRDD